MQSIKSILPVAEMQILEAHLSYLEQQVEVTKKASQRTILRFRQIAARLRQLQLLQMMQQQCNENLKVVRKQSEKALGYEATIAI